MSLTKDFEKRQRWFNGNYPFWSDDDGRELLAHARALETMLKKHEWATRVGRDGDSGCPECREEYFVGHAPDCELAKLLGDVE